MTSSNGNIFRVTSLLCGEFTGPGEFPAQRPVTRSFDVFFDLRLNKRLSKQPWRWWFETSSWSLWRQCNGIEDAETSSNFWHKLPCRSITIIHHPRIYNLTKTLFASLPSVLKYRLEPVSRERSEPGDGTGTSLIVILLNFSRKMSLSALMPGTA